MRNHQRRAKKRRTTRQTKPHDPARPIVEHFHELRRRLMWSVGSVLVLSTAAYFIQQQVVDILLRPAHGQHFIYTSPGGGIGFLFSVCFYVGLIASTPIITYHLIAFLHPVTPHDAKSLITKIVIASVCLAVLGVAFGYFLGLPLAMNFLTHQFTTSQIQPLLTLQAYMSFVTVYLGGSALIFQIPLIIFIANRIKPIPPKKLLGGERYVIVAALVIAMLMAPTINIIYQLVIAVPIILAYQVGILLVWREGRRRQHKSAVRSVYVQKLARHDQLVSALREERLAAAKVTHDLSTRLTEPKHIHVDMDANEAQTSRVI